MSITESSFTSILSLAISSRVVNLEPTTDSAFEFAQSVGVLCFDACAPAHHSRLKEHVERHVAYFKRAEPPKEVEPAQALLVHRLCVCGPLQLIVQHKTTCKILQSLHVLLCCATFSYFSELKSSTYKFARFATCKSKMQPFFMMTSVGICDFKCNLWPLVWM